MQDVEKLLGQMTIEEKVAMLAGTNMWYTVPVERLGIPSLKMTDGPNGARGAGSLTSSVKTTCFPAEISLASTWNTALVERIGQALAQEAKVKGAQVLLAPTVNIQRSPLGGRNFECFSEGLFVGYCYYDKKKIAPLFPFGFGLSYTTFSYSPLRLSAQEIGPGDTLLAFLKGVF